MDTLHKAFPGKNMDDQEDTLNLARLYDLKYNQQMTNLFDQINVENTGGVNEDMDVLGYLGRSKYQRQKRQLHPISENQVMNVIRNEKNKIK